MSRCLIAVALAGLLCGAAFPAQNPPAGVVLQSQSARLNTVDASIGTTLYDGDRLETQSKRALSVRSNQILLTLAEDSLLWMNHENAILTPQLDRGTVIFRVENGEGLEIHSDDVRMRPHGAVLTVGEVTITESEIFITARTQSLDVTVSKQTTVVEEGKTYRVKRVFGPSGGHPWKPPTRVRPPVVPVAIIMAIVVIKAVESPYCP